MSSIKYSIILAGGSGTRLWPLSRNLIPKQFIAMDGEYSLLQKTAQRLLAAFEVDHIYTVTHKDHAAQAREHLAKLNPLLGDLVMAEPLMQNTLPAISWAVAKIYKREPQAVISVFPSDHVITDEASFLRSLQLAQEVASKGHMTLFGIKPDHPATEYGYIQSQGDVSDFEGGAVKKVGCFVEKPDAAKAQQYLDEGNYFWNSGMFVFRADIYMTFLQRIQPKVYELALKLGEMDSMTGDESIYKEFPFLSIDYGLMEFIDKAMVIPVSMFWKDVGGWEAVYQYLDKDRHKNVIQGEAIVLDSQKNLIWNHSDKNLTIFGVDGLVVLQTEDATLICPRDKIGELKKVVTMVKEKQPELG